MANRIRYSSNEQAKPRTLLSLGAAGLLGRALAVVAGGVILVATLFVSALVFSVLLMVGVVAGGWFWWKTRSLRRQMGERIAQMQRMQGGRQPGEPMQDPSAQVIDGDFIRETGRTSADPASTDRSSTGRPSTGRTSTDRSSTGRSSR